MKHLDLFSGIGGFALAAQRVGWQTVAFCESEPFCQSVLRRHWPDVVIHDDIKKLDGTAYRGTVDVLTGGFPCQPFSTAARGRNVAEDLWPEMARLVDEVRPLWVLGENVPGGDFEHIERACSDLELRGYTVRAFDLAVEIRKHIRRRVWVLAHADRDGEPHGPLDAEMACVQAISGRAQRPSLSGYVGTDYGFSGRMDRLAALGNAIEPDIAEAFFRAIAA